jgi:hypothetical protein
MAFALGSALGLVMGADGIGLCGNSLNVLEVIDLNPIFRV